MIRLQFCGAAPSEMILRPVTHAEIKYCFRWDAIRI